MTTQEQIALLAAALQEVGKMPEGWASRTPNCPLIGLFIHCRSIDVEWYDRISDDVAIAALCGVAYSYCARNGIAAHHVLPDEQWLIYPCYDEEYPTEIEALAAAVRMAGQEVGQ